ncbi:hypothetical protein ACTMTJ_16975 [Phytohabitans sp. LJ34]|uniref:hypothetical protein n=1 Tax=Phytohabitans sp. LJ34 TaxID=3452217 RepID=UPI003F8AB33D
MEIDGLRPDELQELLESLDVPAGRGGARLCRVTAAAWPGGVSPCRVVVAGCADVVSRCRVTDAGANLCRTMPNACRVRPA